MAYQDRSRVDYSASAQASGAPGGQAPPAAPNMYQQYPPQSQYVQPPPGQGYAPYPTGGAAPQGGPAQYPPGYGYGQPTPGPAKGAQGAAVAGPRHLGGYRDVWAAFLFILQVLAVQGISLYLFAKGWSASDNSSSTLASAPSPSSSLSEKAYDIRDWLPQLLGAAGVGVVFSWLWLQLLKLMPKFMIYVSLWWGVFASLALGVLFLTTAATAGDSYGFVGLIFIFGGVMQAIYAVCVRSRIPFAAAMLRQAVTVVRLYSSTVWVAYLGVLVSMEVVAVWLLGAAGAADLSNSVLVISLMLLSLFWSMEVIRNVIHTTTCGTVATYYFQKYEMPHNPTGRSLGRALTTSFGSICLGSFIVAFLQTLRALVSMARSDNQDSAITAIISSCAECILACLEAIVRYFNKWAYVQVAVYGKSFVQAARDTWDLFETQGFQLVINDDLTGGALFLGCIFGGLFSSLFSGIWTYTKIKDLTVAIAVIAFFIGYFMTYLTVAVVESAVATYYVCYAEDPATLQRNDPQFYEVIRERHTFLQT
eukprot:TRINITY_DN11064_c0_g1_i2.p1 TRINITY_DN11064_c0_g1~~TRINITY_DN11064_c0_g1_i2.p1  ORF type:complete len:535 (-),score=92.06 TRINITY_DN11064_c0_g1_i2:1182-2786(-)